MNTYDGQNNGYNNPAYNAHKNVVARYIQQNMVACSSTSTLLLFTSSFSPSDISGFFTFKKVKMDDKHGLVTFSLNYSMSSMCPMPKFRCQ